jgi:hypothetical protein
MGLARRRDVERVDRLVGEHRLRVPVDLCDAELVGPLAGTSEIGIADRHHLDPRAEAAPGREMVRADHAGAGESHAQRFRHRGVSPS